MARKPTLSPTKISTFLACPMKYHWTYLDPQGRFYLRAKSYYSFGTSLHRVLERFHDSNDAGVETVQQALAAFDESWIDAGFSSADEMAEAYSEGVTILEAHVEASLSRPSDARTVAIERQLSHDMGDFKLVGRIDRIDEHPDGSIEVIDYKSGRQSVTAEDVRNDLAMAIYQLLVSKLYPGRSVRTTILALRTNIAASSSLTVDELAILEDDLRQLAARIFDPDVESKPVAKTLCASCDFLPLCSRDANFKADLAAVAV